MKKIMHIVDPRRSRSRVPLSASDGKSISVSGCDDSFSLSQLAQAIKTAVSLSKSDAVITVSLPPEVLHLKGSINISGNVHLIGHTSSKASTEGSDEIATRILLDSGAGFVVKSGSLQLSNLVMSAAKKTKTGTSIVSISKGASVEVTECVFDTEADMQNDVLGFLVKGTITMRGSLATNWRVEVEGAGSGVFEATHFVNNLTIKNETCAISIFSIFGKHSLRDCEISGYAAGVLVDASDSDVDLVIDNTQINTLNDGVTVQGANVTLDKCSLTSTNGCAIAVAGIKGNIQMNGGTIQDSEIGVDLNDQAKGIFKDVSIEGPKRAGIRLSESSSAEVEMMTITGNKDAHGIIIRSSSSVRALKLTVNGLKGAAVSISQGSAFTFDGFTAEGNKCGLIASEGSRVEGQKMNSNNNTKGIELHDALTMSKLKDITITGGDFGVFAKRCKKVDVSVMKITDASKCGVLLTDCSGFVSKAHINNPTTKSVGIHIVFDKSNQEKVLLSECKCQNCKVGVRTEQIIEQLAPRKPSERLSQKERNSECDLENCSFIICNVGFYIDAAKATLKGCSFIMSKSHSIFIKNQALKQGSELRMQSKLNIIWPNFVEPHIDNGSALFNDPTLLPNVKKLIAYYASADYEPVMYLPVLTERIRQARNVFRSKEENSKAKAKVIMRSVKDMLLLLKALSGTLLSKQLLEDPDLGMFAATFQLHDEKTGKGNNTLVSMKDLWGSWTSLSRTRLFDFALFALNEALERRQVDQELYDEWVTPLEEMQRVCFVQSKYERRRDYLLTTAKENPLTTWYFLDMEDPNVAQGQILRDEVLRFLAKYDEQYRVHNRDNFHASWVAQWAVNLLGTSFTESNIPEDFFLRKAWADKLLDMGEASRVFHEYKRVGNANNFNTEMDQLMRFEALMLHESQGNKLSQEDYTSLTNMLGGQGFPAAMKSAAKMFRGVGALPGFLRRVAQKAESPESLLEALSHIHEDHTLTNRTLKKYVILAIMGHFLYPDSQTEPQILNTKKKGYETCPCCLVQKLQPWNELRLENCEFNHRFCRRCIKSSMSTRDTQLWGRCPGVTDGKPCPAMATRKEMEMVGMEKEKIFNTLETRVARDLQEIKDWKQCDSPGCIGGRSGVLKDYYTCRLCTKMITMDGDKSYSE